MTNSDISGIPFEAILASANDAVVVTEANPLDNPGPVIVYVNEAFTEITGYQPEDVIGDTPRILQGPGTDQLALARIRIALDKGEAIREQLLNYTKDGEAYWLDINIVPLKNAEGRITHFAAIERDITDQKRLESDLKDLATRDPLTGLLNRRGFAEYTEVLLAAAKRNNTPTTFAILDIDHFKSINDQYGHDVGDQAICYMADMMRSSFRTSDALGRFGGEEFAILFPGTDSQCSETVLNRFKDKIAETPLQTNCGIEVPMTVSIGHAKFIEDAHHLEDLIKLADEALYNAKRAGRNQVRRCEPCELAPSLSRHSA